MRWRTIRDGRDVACSIIRQPWGPDSVAGAARRWVSRVQAGVAHRDKPDRYLEVRYQDLAREPERETRRVAAFIGETWEPAMLDFWRLPHDLAAAIEPTAAAVTRPLYTTSIGRWRREMSPYALWRYRRIAGATLELLGYEG